LSFSGRKARRNIDQIALGACTVAPPHNYVSTERTCFGSKRSNSFTLPRSRYLGLCGEDIVGTSLLKNLGHLNQLSQTLYAVVDTKLGKLDLNAGIGRGSATVSDRWLFKFIVGVRF
jgi:hypothetical protein